MRKLKQKKGITLITTFIFMMTMSVMVAAFLDISAGETRELKGRIYIGRTFWFAEAGLHKGQWLLITPGPQACEENLAVPCVVTEVLDEGSYTFTIERPAGNPTQRRITSVGSYEKHTYTVKQEFDLV